MWFWIFYKFRQDGPVLLVRFLFHYPYTALFQLSLIRSAFFSNPKPCDDFHPNERVYTSPPLFGSGTGLETPMGPSWTRGGAWRWARGGPPLGDGNDLEGRKGWGEEGFCIYIGAHEISIDLYPAIRWTLVVSFPSLCLSENLGKSLKTEIARRSKWKTSVLADN